MLTCIREGCTIDDARFRCERTGDRHLEAPDEMARLFASHPEAMARTLKIADRCTFSLSELCYQYPDESEAPGETPQAALVRPVQSIPPRCPAGLPRDVATLLRHELRLIARQPLPPIPFMAWFTRAILSRSAPSGSAMPGAATSVGTCTRPHPARVSSRTGARQTLRMGSLRCEKPITPEADASAGRRSTLGPKKSTIALRREQRERSSIGVAGSA